jgi:hypothetical protein
MKVCAYCSRKVPEWAHGLACGPSVETCEHGNNPEFCPGCKSDRPERDITDVLRSDEAMRAFGVDRPEQTAPDKLGSQPPTEPE